MREKKSEAAIKDNKKRIMFGIGLNKPNYPPKKRP
jgi:hypothetical protein